MELLKIYNNARETEKRIEKLKNEQKVSYDVHNMLKDILNGSEETRIRYNETFEALSITKPSEKYCDTSYFYDYYKIKINKKLIKIVQEYIDKEEIQGDE